MKAKEIYKIYFPYKEGQGGKRRPVLVFILTSKPNKFIALKVTKTKREQNRVSVDYWKEAGLDVPSYVECDHYAVLETTGTLEFVGTLEQSDYDKIVLKFNEYYPILEWMKEAEQ